MNDGNVALGRHCSASNSHKVQVTQGRTSVQQQRCSAVLPSVEQDEMQRCVPGRPGRLLPPLPSSGHQRINFQKLLPARIPHDQTLHTSRHM